MVSRAGPKPRREKPTRSQFLRRIFRRLLQDYSPEQSRSIGMRIFGGLSGGSSLPNAESGTTSKKAAREAKSTISFQVLIRFALFLVYFTCRVTCHPTNRGRLETLAPPCELGRLKYTSGFQYRPSNVRPRDRYSGSFPFEAQHASWAGRPLGLQQSRQGRGRFLGEICLSYGRPCDLLESFSGFSIYHFDLHVRTVPFG